MLNKILTSIHGRKLGLDHEGNLVVTSGGVVTGEPGSQFKANSLGTIAIFDDFTNIDLADDWVYTEGTDSATSSLAIVGQGIGGVARFTTGDAGTGYAADAAQLTPKHRLFRAVNGNLTFETRLKLSAITTCYVFVGFTDTVAASLEAPIISAASANTITTNATDAVGFMFDTNMADDNWWLVGVANNTDAVHQNTGFAPVAATYERLRIELDSDGNAYFYRNGVLVGSRMDAAVTATALLAPILTVSKLSVAASMTMDVDYLYTSCDRV